MKLLSSSESSPFSSFSSCSSSTITTNTTTTFDLSNSKDVANGCIAGILRRILCYGSLPTYPSDHIPEETSLINQSQHGRHFKSKEKAEERESSATPSLVARLMGLESIPDADFVSTPKPISRSRSMNSADRLDRDPIQAHDRRRVKSFREMPTFIESEDFLVLSFENGSESKERRSKGRKCEAGDGEMRKKKAGKSRNKENRKERGLEKEKKQAQEKKSRMVLKDSNGREMLKTKASHKPKETICDVPKNVESECSSEDLSPVSVLDCGPFLVDNGVPTSEEDSVLASSFPRRKDDCLTCDARKPKTIEGKCLGTMKKKYHTAEYYEILDEICTLTEAELAGSNWSVHKGIWNDHEGSAGIATDFESQILDELIEEVVDQLGDFPTGYSKPRNSKRVRIQTHVLRLLALFVCKTISSSNFQSSNHCGPFWPGYLNQAMFMIERHGTRRVAVL